MAPFLFLPFPFLPLLHITTSCFFSCLETHATPFSQRHRLRIIGYIILYGTTNHTITHWSRISSFFFYKREVKQRAHHFPRTEACCGFLPLSFLFFSSPSSLLPFPAFLPIGRFLPRRILFSFFCLFQRYEVFLQLSGRRKWLSGLVFHAFPFNARE